MMGFSFLYIYFMEQMVSICKNPWCRAKFSYKESDICIDNHGDRLAPANCPKCKSFESELSGGIEWKTKTYEGSRFDGMPHEMKYKVTNYKL